MVYPPSTFVLLVGNRDLFPPAVLSDARRELQEIITGAGCRLILPPEDLTPLGAVKDAADARSFAKFLKDHQGSFDGIILTLPNFGDENGAAQALRDAQVPVLIHGYPDTLDAMSPEFRRDAFCGKLSVMNVLRQYRIPFTALKPHVLSPKDPRFLEHLHTFDGICRVVKHMRRCTLGALGARTTAFKTVRFDEATLQNHGITVESLDLSEVFSRVKSADPASTDYREKHEELTAYADCSRVPAPQLDSLVRLGTVLDEIIREYELDMIALRCWMEMQKELQISPCVLLGLLNERGVTAACEMDGTTAAAMYALQLAANRPAACLDWNNNYGEDEEKCILFHCGPVAASMLASQQPLAEHAILGRVLGPGTSCGCHPGRIAPGPMTFAGGRTEEGLLSFYFGEGEFTTDPIPADYFGSAGVARVPGLQEVLYTVGTQGYHHHVAAVHGRTAEVLREAFETYLGFGITPWRQ